MYVGTTKLRTPLYHDQKCWRLGQQCPLSPPPKRSLVATAGKGWWLLKGAMVGPRIVGCSCLPARWGSFVGCKLALRSSFFAHTALPARWPLRCAELVGMRFAPESSGLQQPQPHQLRISLFALHGCPGHGALSGPLPEHAIGVRHMNTHELT